MATIDDAMARLAGQAFPIGAEGYKPEMVLV